MFNPRAQEGLVGSLELKPTAMLKNSLNVGTPWDSVVDFATHKDFCGFPIFPKQATLLKLIFLETEHMTAYDLEVIGQWCEGFKRHKDIFGVQPDIWQRIEYLKQRGYRRFPHIQAVLGRRASKGVIGAFLAVEQISYLFSMDDPQAHYGIAAGKDVFGNVGATSQTQAQRHQFGDIRTMVSRCKYLQPGSNNGAGISEIKDHLLRVRTRADMRRIAEMQAAKVPIEHPIASIWATALSASSVSGRGATSYFNMFDEFAFHIHGSGSVKSGEEIYEDWQPSLGQFGKDALTYVPSSPFSRIGKFYELYQHGRVLMSTYTDHTGIGDEARDQLSRLTPQAGVDEVELEAEPTWLIFQGPSWALYEDWASTPKILGLGYGFPNAPESDMSDEIQVRRKRRNPEKFKVEREGQFAEVQGAYLDADKVEKMFDTPSWRPALEAQSFGTFNRQYRIHCDPGRTGANFALAIGHTEDAPPDEHGHVWPHVVFDLLHVWRPQDFPIDETGKHVIDYVQVNADIEGILTRFRSTTKVTFDQWNSASFLASLKQKFSPSIRVSEVTFTQAVNQDRCEKFKSALNLGWTHAYRDSFFTDDTSSLLEQELKFLSEHNGKVVKQEIGPVVTKDLADCVMVVTVDLLHDALDSYDSKTMTASAYGSTDIGGLKSGREFERISALGGGSPRPSAREQLDNNKLERVRGRRSEGTRDRLNSIYARGR